MRQAFAILLVLAFVIFSGCSQSAVAPPPTDRPLPTPTAAPSPVAITKEDVDTARQVVFDYFEAFNQYDVEGVLAFLEESYRQDKAESIEEDIDRMKSFGAKLGVEEESEPVITPEGKIEIYIKLRTPIGAQYVTYQLLQESGEWKICLSEE